MVDEIASLTELNPTGILGFAEKIGQMLVRISNVLIWRSKFQQERCHASGRC
jgi:hypothetical protein